MDASEIFIICIFVNDLFRWNYGNTVVFARFGELLEQNNRLASAP